MRLRLSFRPGDLTQTLQQRFIGKLGLDIGLFYRDLEKLYKKHRAEIVPALPRYYDAVQEVCPDLQENGFSEGGGGDSADGQCGSQADHGELVRRRMT